MRTAGSDKDRKICGNTEIAVSALHIIECAMEAGKVVRLTKMVSVPVLSVAEIDVYGKIIGLYNLIKKINNLKLIFI